MNPEEALNKIKKQIPTGTDIKTAIEIFITFFEDESIAGCDKNNDGDLLLFQWGGPYSWNNSYTINITRQFSFNDKNGEYLGMKQLSMDYKYSPESINIEPGSFWLSENNTNEFRKNIFNSSVIKKTENLETISIEFELDEV